MYEQDVHVVATAACTRYAPFRIRASTPLLSAAFSACARTIESPREWHDDRSDADRITRVFERLCLTAPDTPYAMLPGTTQRYPQDPNTFTLPQPYAKVSSAERAHLFSYRISDAVAALGLNTSGGTPTALVLVIPNLPMVPRRFVFAYLLYVGVFHSRPAFMLLICI